MIRLLFRQRSSLHRMLGKLATVFLRQSDKHGLRRRGKNDDFGAESAAMLVLQNGRP